MALQLICKLMDGINCSTWHCWLTLLRCVVSRWKLASLLWKTHHFQFNWMHLFNQNVETWVFLKEIFSWARIRQRVAYFGWAINTFREHRIYNCLFICKEEKQRKAKRRTTSYQREMEKYADNKKMYSLLADFVEKTQLRWIEFKIKYWRRSLGNLMIHLQIINDISAE